MRLFLTRLGHNCTAIIDGDLKQKDIRGLSGLEDSIRRIEHLPDVGLVEFDDDECVRSGIARDILFAYR
jgi:phosphate starvation-inducible PhoH-like protein